MHWPHHSAQGSANSGVGGWAKHQLARVVNFAAPRSDDFLPVVLDRENAQRASWAHRSPQSADSQTDRRA